MHDRWMGPPVDLSGLGLERYPRPLVERAGRVWQERVQSEFRSIQIMNRFLGEVLGAGDPLDVYAGVVELIEDEVRHVALCAALCEALGAPACLPATVPLVDPEPFLRAPMRERALTTAITMLAINETLSVGYIADLHARCENPAVLAVLGATLGDEAEHEELGWSYIRQGLAAFPRSTLGDWRHLVNITLAPHLGAADQVVAALPAGQRSLEAHPERELAAMGLFSRERQALVTRRVYEEKLAPGLRELELLL
jgi:hypothetical protein